MNVISLLPQLRHLPALLTIATIWKQANDDNVPGFTLAQGTAMIDAAFPLLPANIKATATRPELQAALTLGTALYNCIATKVLAPVTEAISIGKALIEAVQALLQGPTTAVKAVPHVK